jgi:hypothetical protein
MTQKGRIHLGEPLDGMLQDFCAAHYGPPQTEIIRAALRAFIEHALDREPEMRKRYELARAERLRGSKPLSIVKDAE